MGYNSLRESKFCGRNGLVLKTKEYGELKKWTICNETGEELTQLFDGEKGNIIQRDDRDHLGNHIMSLIFIGKMGCETKLYRFSIKEGKYESPNITSVDIGTYCQNVEMFEIRDGNRSNNTNEIKVTFTKDGENNTIIVSSDFNRIVKAKGSIIEKRNSTGDENKTIDLSPFVIDSISQSEDPKILILNGTINSKQKHCLFSKRRFERISTYVDSIGESVEFESSKSANKLYPHSIIYKLPNSEREFIGVMLINGEISPYVVDQLSGQLITVPIIGGQIPAIDDDKLDSLVRVSDETLKKQSDIAMKLSGVSLGTNEIIPKEIRGIRLQYEIERTIDREICGIGLKAKIVRTFKVGEGIHLNDLIKVSDTNTLKGAESSSTLTINTDGREIATEIKYNCNNPDDMVLNGVCVVNCSSHVAKTIKDEKLEEVLDIMSSQDYMAISNSINLDLFQPKNELKQGSVVKEKK